MLKVFSKAGKPDRVVTSASEETAAVFDGFREVKAEEAEPADKRTDAEREADEQAKAAKAKPTAPKPTAPKSN